VAKRKNRYSEKRKPTYLLKEIRELIKKNKIESPNISVSESANNIDFSITEGYQEILNLENSNFYESATEPYNRKVWQDVYKKVIKGIPIYIKFKIFRGNFLLTSFKRDQSQ